MKSLQQFLEAHNFLIKGHTKDQHKDISVENFQKDLIKIATDAGAQYVEYNGGGKDKEKATQPLFCEIRKLSNSYVFDLTYMLEISDYAKQEFQKYGYNIREDSYILSIEFWDDKDLERPRYMFNGFRILLPATNNQGYGSYNILKFPSKKLTDEYYNLALDSLTDIINCFVKGTNVMLDIYKKCRGKMKNPQKTDFTKVAKTVFKNYTL